MKKPHPALLIGTMCVIGLLVLCMPLGCNWAEHYWRKHQANQCLITSPGAGDQCWLTI